MMEGFVKYAVEMGSGAMIFIRSVIKIGSGIQTLIWGINRHTDRWEGFIKYAVEMGSGDMIYISSLIKIGCQSKLDKGDRQTAR
jgi:hypothetical protein